ncbi:hypothetical protein Tco_0655379 [Tanacetum coccineum]|uniref:Uncharacterized protein n=1 Tax=Tanacetum coccineum TaxID=301880 RepID=A0ABQ4X6T5_9ASTR
MRINYEYLEDSIRLIQDMESIRIIPWKLLQQWSLLQEIPNTPYPIHGYAGYDDLHNLSSVEAEFPAIVINNAVAPQDELQCKSQVNMALPPREQRYRFLRYEGLEYPDTDIVDYEGRLARIHRREVYRVHVLNFRRLLNLMAEGLSGRMLMEHRDEADEAYELEAVHLSLGITHGGGDADGWVWCLLGRECETDPRQGGSERLLDEDLIVKISWQLIYTLIKDPILRLCHRLIACSIAGRSQAPEKVTMIDLFYLRGMDVDSVNVPYLLARYLRLFDAGRKSGAHISGRQFIAGLAEHFGLLTAQILGGLTVIALELPSIDMTELVRLKIFAEDAPIIDEGGQADPAPEHLTGLSEGAHLQHSRDGPDRGLVRPAPPQHGRTCSSLTHVPSYPYLTKPGRPREGNTDEYWWRIYESRNLEVLES